MRINFTYDSSVNNAPSGFITVLNQAKNFLEANFADPISLNINVGYGTIGGQNLVQGALGESLTYFSTYSYSQIKAAFAADAKTAIDSSVVSSLPASDPTGGHYWVPTAEAKALGLSGDSASLDGMIGFDAGVTFDYDSSNGITAGQYDFFGSVMHEITEVMGRQLIVGATLSGSANSYAPMDLLHFSAPGTHIYTGTRAGYFSADNGNTALNDFNTNSNGDFGDWASSAAPDAFLAIGSSGTVEPVTANDLKVMDALGWDLSSSASNAPPVVAVSDHTLNAAEWAQAANWISYSDANGNPAIKFQWIDNGADANSGYVWTPSNAHNPANSVIEVNASDLSNVWIRGGASAGSETMSVRAFDGTDWGNWTTFTLTTRAPNTPPVATIADHTLRPNEWARVGDWLSYSDADNNAAVRYQFWDSGTDPNSGYFWTPANAHNPANTAIDVAASDLANVWVRGGAVNGSETMWVRAYDGTDWGAWDSFSLTTHA